MEVRRFKKLYNRNIASLRDYEVKHYIEKGGVIFDYKGKRMTLSQEDLIHAQFNCHGKFIKSKIETWKNPISGLNGYKLIDFVFKPNKKEKNNGV